MDFEQLFNLVLGGLTQGAIYALLAIGYNVIFATTGVLNFAHGELFMVGALLGAVIYSEQSWPLVLALILVVLVAAALGAIEEKVAVRPATSKEGHVLGWVLSTLGFAIILRSGAALVFGPDFRNFRTFTSSEPTVVGGVRFVPDNLVLIAVAVLVAIAVHIAYTRSMTGRALAAVAQDQEAAAMRGIPVSRLSLLSFAIGSGVAALTGFVAGPLTGAFPTIGFNFALKGFIAAAIGGIPSIGGALFGGFFLGLVEVLGADYIGGGYRMVVVFAALIAILVVRPAGLFGQHSVRSV